MQRESAQGVKPIERLRRATPILEFVLLAFVIAYTVGFGLLWLCRSFTGTWSQYLPRIGVVYAPAIAALLVTGRTGAPALLRKLNPRGQWLWVPVLLAIGIACTAGAALAAGVQPQVLTRAARAWPLFAAHALLQFAFAGCGEELGWRGWLLPRMLTRYQAVVAALIVGAIWGCWHVPILLSGARPASIFLFGVLGLSVLFTALWQRVNGNVFVLAVAHASVNAPLAMLDSRVAMNAVFVLYGILGSLTAIAMNWSSNKTSSNPRAAIHKQKAQ